MAVGFRLRGKFQNSIARGGRDGYGFAAEGTLAVYYRPDVFRDGKDSSECGIFLPK